MSEVKSCSLIFPMGPLTDSEIRDLICAYLASEDLPVETKPMSEGYLCDLLWLTNGLHFDQVRALWFDAVTRGNAIVERYESARNSLPVPLMGLRRSGVMPAITSLPGSTDGNS